jgi:hypothetical protein
MFISFFANRLISVLRLIDGGGLILRVATVACRDTNRSRCIAASEVHGYLLTFVNVSKPTTSRRALGAIIFSQEVFRET